MPCSVPSCQRPVYARGWCDPHYRRWRKSGDVDPETPLWRPTAPPHVRFLRYVVPGPPSTRYPELGPCLLWAAFRTNGYGTFYDGTRNVRAHRFAWEWEHGPIPPGMVLDHLCCVPACVRSAHLEVVTPSENSRRMNARRRVPRSVRSDRSDSLTG